jgi:1,3-beta-glucan synthase
MSRGNSRAHSNSWIGYHRLSRLLITGYKKKRSGHPSERLTSDQRRAPWQAVIFSEIIFPTALAILFVIVYLFVKSFPAVPGKQNTSPLVRLAVISLGLIVWNAMVLLVLFFFGFLSFRLVPEFHRLGSIIAFIAHVLGLVGMIGFFEFFVGTILYVQCILVIPTLF